MEKIVLAPIMQYFTGIEDPRIETKNKKYPLEEVIVITIVAVMSFAQGWEDIERYGKAKEARLKKFLKLESGIPSHDVYRRVLSRLKPKLLEECFMNWVRDMKQHIAGEVIAIDGKTARSSFRSAEGKAAHFVSAWATANRLVFGQVKTEEKSNEITAIPTLLEAISIEGCTVTIDAMGCQYKIAGRILKKNGDFLFSLKGNQNELHQAVIAYWEGLDFNKPAAEQARHIKFTSTSTHDEGHGRIEDRDYAVSGDVGWLHEAFPRWNTIRSIGIAESTRTIGEQSTAERRFFVSSLPPDIARFAHAVRAHWGIENQVHYVLDAAFGEDDCRIREGNAPENMAFIRKIALTAARSDKTTKSSVKGRIKQMAWSEDYLEKLLFRSSFAEDQDAPLS